MSEDIHEMTHGADKRVALLIAVLALLLFLSEAGGKSAQHHSTEYNIESSDLWNFYQAKRIRSTILDTNARVLDLGQTVMADDAIKAAMKKQSDDWKATVARYKTEPGEGLEELSAKAKHAAEKRDYQNLRFEHFEYGSGLLQLAIVIASASIITGVAVLVYLSGILGLGGALLLAFGHLAPMALPIFGAH